MSKESRTANKDALVYALGGLVLALTSCGAEYLLSSFAHPVLNFFIISGLSYTVFDGAIYFFGKSLPEEP